MGGPRTGNTADKFARAMQAYEKGRKAEARKLAGELTQTSPRFSGGHYLAGLLALDRDNNRQAVRHLAEAVALTPGQSVLHLALARALEGENNTAEALLHYRTVLQLAPNHAHAHARLGELLHKRGEAADAAAHFIAATAVDPGHADAWNGLGVLQLENNDPQAAAQSLRRALDLRPSWPTALNNYGLALHRCGQCDAAIDALSGAVDLRPDHAGSRVNLSSVLRAVGRLADARDHADKAVRAAPKSASAWMELGEVRRAMKHPEGAASAFDRACALAPDRADAWFCLAESLRDSGDLDRARHAYRHCLTLDRDDVHGAVLGLALSGGGTPEQAPGAYVGRLFDEYADRFETSLVGALNYRGPEIIAEIVARILDGRSGLTVIDAGCGTGLMGPILRPYAGRLTGIDLSAQMLEKAAQKNLYDGLSKGCVVDVLGAVCSGVDMIVAADVLIYMGDLGPFLTAARRALTFDPGFLVATVETAQDCPTYRLGAKRRYAHSIEYLRAQADVAGFREVLIEPQIIRSEAGEPVQGLVAVFVKQPRASD